MSCVQDLSKNYFFRCKLTLREINLKQNRLHSEKRVGEGSCEIVLLLKKISARVSASFKILCLFPSQNCLRLKHFSTVCDKNRR